MSAAAARARAYRLAAGDATTVARTTRATTTRAATTRAATTRATTTRAASSRSARPAAAQRAREATNSTGYLRLVPMPQEIGSRSVAGVRIAPRVSLFFLFMVVGVIMVIIFQAMIAEQQLRLDSVSRNLELAEYNYEDLRQERAELLAPNRLRYEAMSLGMYQGLSTKFVEIPADVVAAVVASTGKMDPQLADPLPGSGSAVDVVNGIADPNAPFVMPVEEVQAP
jgi:hypothetical protein